MLIDTHFHLDFLPDPTPFKSAPIIAQTLTPTAYLAQPHIPRHALGLHPWYAALDELPAFAAAVDSTKFIGEVGLDYRFPHQEAFRRLVDLTVSSSRTHVMSIHAVRSVTAALDILDEFDPRRTQITPIIHWFTGTSDELTRHIRAGGFISVNPRMLETKRGRAYVTQVPADRLLVETDLPREAGEMLTPEDHAAIIQGIVDKLSELRGEDMTARIEETQREIL